MNRYVEPELLLEVVEQVEDLALDRDIEGGHGLVADDELGVQGERPGDADALALAAGELVRVAMDVALVEPDPAEQLADDVFARSLVLEAVHERALADDLADRHPRVQAGIRVLEHDLHVAPDRDHLAIVELEDRAPVDGDLARRRRDEPEQDLAERGLAAARLPDEAQGLAAKHVEAHAVDGLDGADLAHAEETTADLEVLDEVLDLDQHARLVIGARCTVVADRRGPLHRDARRRGHLGGWCGRHVRLGHDGTAGLVGAVGATASAATRVSTDRRWASASATSGGAAAPTAGGSPVGVSQQRDR